MSKEVAISAVITISPDKVDRARELILEAIAWIKTNEPDTLSFTFWEEHPTSSTTHTSNDSRSDTNSKGPRFFMFERYRNQAALDAHEASDNYKQFFTTMVQEELLVGPPDIVRGGAVGGFSR